MIESVNSTYRKLNRQRSVFPSDTVVLKAGYLKNLGATDERVAEFKARHDEIVRTVAKEYKDGPRHSITQTGTTYTSGWLNININTCCSCQTRLWNRITTYENARPGF